jgi:hypothetical protein
MPADTNSATPSKDRLDSWKEIAAYLKRGVRTIQRWEQTDGLPIRRLGQDRAGPVFAYRAELDAWWQEQSRRLEPDPEPEPPAHPSALPAQSSRRLIAILSLIAIAAAGILWRMWPPARVA